MGNRGPVFFKLFFIISLLVLSTSLFGGIVVEKGLGINGEIGIYQSIPAKEHADLLPVRTHLTFGASLEPIILKLSQKSELSLALSGYYTTRSIVYGISIWRPFGAIGPTLNFTFHLDNHFAIKAAATAFISFYTQTAEIVPVYRISIAPEYEIAPSNSKNHWILTIPISLDIRNSYLSVATTFGFKWKLNTKKEIVNESN